MWRQLRGIRGKKSMNKIQDAFTGGKAFIAYLMAGDPNLAVSAEYILEAQKAGADLIEIGIPFSDPIAEGEVIQNASVRALASGARLDGIFQMVADIKDQMQIPMVFMTYLNPVFVYGYDRFFAKCVEIGVSGIIIPDLPFEEQSEVKHVAKQYGIAVITLVAPTSQTRTTAVAKDAEGFVYMVSSLGVTGMRREITTDIPAMVAEIKRYASVPVAVGFGIATTDQAADIAASADGVIVGSAIVNLIAQHGANAHAPLRAYIQSMKAAITDID